MDRAPLECSSHALPQDPQAPPPPGTRHPLCRGRRLYGGPHDKPLFPRWKGLLLAGVERLRAEGKDRHAEFVRFLVEVDQDYLGAAQRLRRELGALWSEFLRDQLLVKKTDVAAASLALPRAVWKLGSRVLVTTNYDHVLGWTCPDELLTEYDLTCWDIESVAEQAELLRAETMRPTVWHLHGRIDNVVRLVLTPDGYRRLYGSDEQEERHRAALATLRKLLASRSFLFLGFSLDDECFGVELRGVRELYQGFDGPHYAFVRAKDAERVRKLGVEPLIYEDHSDLPALVEELGREAATSADAPAPILPDEPPPTDWTAYLESVMDQTGHVEIRGISSSSSVEAPVHWNEGRLPEGRSRVYGAVVRWLLAARKKQRKAAGYGDRFAHRALARLALAMMGTKGGKRTVLDLEDAAVAIDAVAERELPDVDEQERRHRSREWLRFECLGSGLVEEVAGNRVRFWHLTFQEYLAALELAWRGDGEDEAADWWPVVSGRLDDAQWRETVELLPGCLFDEGGEGRVDRLLTRVLEMRGDKPGLAEEARVAGIVGRLLQPLSVYGYKVRPEVASAYEEALERSMAIFTVEGAAKVPVEVRIAAAEALGRGGDPRLVSLEENLIEVPGCDGWRLGKYPVTVEEFHRFVEMRGYEERKHWSEEGWLLREGKDWDEPGSWEEQLATPNRPVVLVSWYEAEAYCAWLSEQRSAEVRLPAEAWWEAAATPESGKYPWGEAEPDAERANFLGKVGAPTPVGIYPTGNGRLGHCDLAGNIWE